jgi:predicted XRE-type DNA-binding protein
MKTVGQGVKEIRIRDATGVFRVIYVAKFADAVYVLHCFQKKTEKTSKSDLDLASKRYRDLLEGARQMSNQRFTNVWDAIEDTPEEAENMKLRSALMRALKNHISQTGMSQAQAAKLFGVTQPRVSDLMRGKINLFGLDALVNMATAAGLHIELRVREVA